MIFSRIGFEIFGERNIPSFLTAMQQNDSIEDINCQGLSIGFKAKEYNAPLTLVLSSIKNVHTITWLSGFGLPKVCLLSLVFYRNLKTLTYFNFSDDGEEIISQCFSKTDSQYTRFSDDAPS